MKIAVIGTGSVGGTLGAAWAKHGHNIVFGSREPSGSKVRSLIKLTQDRAASAVPTDAVNLAEVVVIATPWNATEASIRALKGLKDRIVIDCTNPLESGGLAVGHQTSGAELVAEWAAGARVVKAFNSTGYNVMAQPSFNGRAASMFVCGDDPAANRVGVQLAEEIGFDAIDCGPLRVARYLEPLAALWVHLAYAQGLGREMAFSILKR